MLPKKKLNHGQPALEVRLRTTRGLLLLCACVFVLSSLLLASGCGTPQTTAGQGTQTRPRRIATPENSNTLVASANSDNRNKQMSDTDEENKTPKASAPFYTALDAALERREMKLNEVCDRNDAVARRILEDYGAVFVAADKVLPPPVCIFQSEAAVLRFQQEAGVKAAIVGGTRIELQPAAMDALQAAREEARREGLDITPRGGEEAARRSYQDTVRLWDTRFLPALAHWRTRGRLSPEQVARLKSLSLKDQVREVLELEQSGIYFSKDFSKSILYSIAAPGTSQHIMLLALDVDQFLNPRVRSILARHGWFQTVKSDLPHFTYLGLEEKELPARGLRSVKSGSQLFWIPNVDENE